MHEQPASTAQRTSPESSPEGDNTMDDTPADRKALEDVQDQVAAQIASYLRVTQEARDRSRGVVLEDSSGLQKQFRALLAI